MTPTYYGVFQYSPNNLNPTLFTEGDWQYKNCLDRIKDAEEFFQMRMERLNNEPPSEIRDSIITERTIEFELKVLSLKVKPENNVFYIADEEFNILFETNKVFDKGHWTKEVHKGMKKFGLNFDNTMRMRTDGTLEQLKENVRIHNSLTKRLSDKNKTN